MTLIIVLIARTNMISKKKFKECAAFGEQIKHEEKQKMEKELEER